MAISDAIGCLLNFLSLHVVKHPRKPFLIRFWFRDKGMSDDLFAKQRWKGALGSGDPEEPYTVPASKLPQYVEVKGVT